MADTLKKILDHIESQRGKYVQALKPLIAIQSISAVKAKRKDTTKAVQWIGSKLKALGAIVEICQLGKQSFPDGTIIDMPPVVLAKLGSDVTKKRLCVYGHVDVIPTKREGWKTDPFVMTEKDGALYGRGVADDKGPVVAWLCTVEAFKDTGVSIPVNLKFIIEGNEECGSGGLRELFERRKEELFGDVDFFVMSNSYRLMRNSPCVVYGTRGFVEFTVNVTGGNRDVRGGTYTGTMHEAMSDVIYLLSSLMDKEDKILIPDIEKHVAPVSEQEKAYYNLVDFDEKAYTCQIGTTHIRYTQDKVELLKHRWRLPAMSINGVEGSYSGPTEDPIVPKKASGTFTIYIVPNQTPQEIEKLVSSYFQEKWAERGSGNTMEVKIVNAGDPWLINPDDSNCMAARKAIKHLFQKQADLIREGRAFNILLLLQNFTRKNILMLPIGGEDDGAHRQNENILVNNYIDGIKLYTCYLFELSQISK